ncbi:hypothetical protein BCR32DRAFT_280238 [Anaeromyces robustus]|uniref:Uncharacterized protein n=1 Tax=Anaeromyces robustus TaxID=1754192 RepID=A0A1Y1X661_9FUNG|nr:hypothetical protein BCR32DRAFT_280238 [Anaeromyces robustus]|eukprot:ORX80794.1 hypothetical protein BCR32DRAFT_280238 [Anaeromyces robustus]
MKSTNRYENENFMIFKNSDLIIFQSSFQAYLFSNYHENIFADATYEALFEEIKKNANKFRSNTLITPINLYCDFEQGISNVAKKVFPEINIKYCVWHYKRSLEKQKNILCYNEKKKTYNDYERRTKGIWKKKKQKIFSKTDEIKNLIENYKNKEINLFNNGCNRNELVKLWKDCLIDLNNI